MVTVLQLIHAATTEGWRRMATRQTHRPRRRTRVRSRREGGTLKNDRETGRDHAESVFADAPLGYETIRGTRTFESVLFSEAHAERTVPVDVRTGERTRQIARSVERAKAFVADDPRRVAVPQTTEAQIETQSAPYVSTVFYDSTVVRGKLVGDGECGRPEYENDGHALEWTYRAAVNSDAHEVELLDADYETGNVTIRVTITEENR